MTVTSSVTYTNTMEYSSTLTSPKEDVSDMIHELSPWSTPLLNVLPGGIKGITVGNTTHYFNEQEWTPGRTTLASAISSTSSSTLKVSDAIFRAGEVVRIDAETCTLGATSDGLTFTAVYRSRGAGAAATHSAGALVVGANAITGQGAAAGTAQAMIQPKKQTNYTTILREDIKIANTVNAVAQYGKTGTNEYDYQKERMLVRMFKQLEERVLFGYSQANSGSTGGGMKGIYESVVGTNTAALGGTNPTWDNLESYVRAINAWDDGRSDLYLLCSLYFAGVLDSWGQGKITYPVGANELPNQMLGTNVKALYIGGRRLIVIPYNYFDSQAFIIDPRFVRVGPLAGRQFQHFYIGTLGDSVTGMLVGEYTCECAAAHAHYILTGMKTS